MSKTSNRRFVLLDSALAGVCLLLFGYGLATQSSFGQTALGPNCTATILNRSVQLDQHGGFAIPNLPSDQLSLYRVRIVCTQPDGTVSNAQSALLHLVPNGTTKVGVI